MIDSDQIRDARTLFHLEQQDLAKQARIPIATVRRAQATSRSARVSPRAIALAQHALEAAGAEFTDNGVRRRKRRMPEEREALFRDIIAMPIALPHWYSRT